MEDIRTSVKDIFMEYIERKGYRRTSERFAILDEIYSRTGHFSIEDLLHFMNGKKYRVSRATLYNTMELLLDSKLVIRHRFDNHETVYESTYNTPPHDHLICTGCARIEEFNHARLHSVAEELKSTYEFDVHSHLFYVYGLCKNCKIKSE